jgi:hypothetical protein
MTFGLTTFRPDPEVSKAEYDSEMPCERWWNSHSATFLSGLVSEPTTLVPFVFNPSNDAICTSYS